MQKEDLKTILWVDDEIDLLAAHIIFLREKGYNILEASNGDDAIEIVNKGGVDLVLLDEMMPGRDGLSTLEGIKDLNPNLPVIMVTKSEEEHLMNEAIGKKIDDYLTKPVNLSQILSAVKKILERQKLTESNLTREFVSEFSKINMRLSGQMNWKEWLETHIKLSEIDLEMERLRDVGLKQSFKDLKKQSSAEFGRFVMNNYESWVNSTEGPPLSVDVVKNHVVPLLKEGIQTFFIVIDCMRLDQWILIEAVLADYFNIKRSYYYSILPTATPFSRNAIFAGEFPDKVAELSSETWINPLSEVSRNRNERQLLDRNLAKQGLNFKSEPKYVKVLDYDEGQNLAKKIKTYSSVPLLSVVYNFVDIMIHGRSESDILQEIAPNEAAFRSLVKSWFEHSHLFEMLRKLSTTDCAIVITTDHGSVIGTRGAVAYGKKDTSSNLRYKYGDNLNCDPKQSWLIKQPKSLKLPIWGLATTYIIALEDYYFVYPTKYSEYRRQYRDSFQHGGISPDEMILPVSVLTPK
ncbi:MAG: response regulator [candidate division Zixibacteria bacterium]